MSRLGIFIQVSPQIALLMASGLYSCEGEIKLQRLTTWPWSLFTLPGACTPKLNYGSLLFPLLSLVCRVQTCRKGPGRKVRLPNKLGTRPSGLLPAKLLFICLSDVTFVLHVILPLVFRLI